MKYFTNDEEYPSNVCDDLLPWGTFWCYVSSTFLNGFINYVHVEKAYLANRYTEMDEVIECGEHAGTTKRSVFDKLTVNPPIHANLHAFSYDLVLLTKISEGKYMMFWFDCDVSDCCIGRFVTADTEADVIAEFDKFVNKVIPSHAEIPLNFFKGWMSF